MKIRDSINLEFGFPGGSYASVDDFKFTYSGLLVKNIEREHERKLRFDILDGNNELRILLTAKSETGEEELQIIESNKDKLVGKTVDETINTEL